jgi:polynucleotide 5'-hydroxyl-kinase GRC3/NOL9
MFTTGKNLLNLTLESGKTLLIDGPAAVMIKSGKATVFGCPVNSGQRTVIREGKRAAFEVEVTASFEIFAGEHASAETYDGKTMPVAWSQIMETLLKAEKPPFLTLVIGGTDTGKTSLCTYLANRLICLGKRVAVIDGDIGQSDIGPPCTVAYCIPSRPTVDLFELKLENAFFVGATSPSENPSLTIEGLQRMKNEVSEKSVEYILVNTDGWVIGDEGFAYKRRVIQQLKPDLILCLQREDELKPLLETLGCFSRVSLNSPVTVMPRDKDKRRSHRTLGYLKHLTGAKIRIWYLSEVSVDDCMFGLGQKPSPNISRIIHETLGIKPVHASESLNTAFIIIEKDKKIDQSLTGKLEENIKKKVNIAREGDESGLLTGLYNADMKFLGIGILRSVNYSRRILKIFTPVSKKPYKIVLGRTWLDEGFKENKKTILHA